VRVGVRGSGAGERSLGPPPLIRSSPPAPTQPASRSAACVCLAYRSHTSRLELLFVNAQHLAARLREAEALGALLREHEDVVAQARALLASAASAPPAR
jgi:hypothetical protein